MTKSVWLVCVCLLAAPAAAETFDLSASATETPAALAKAVPKLATRVISVYRDNDHPRYLDTLFRLQLVAGLYSDAARTLAELHALRADDASPGTAAKDLQYDIFLRAKALESTGSAQFADAFMRVFRETLAHLDDKTSAMLVRAMSHYSAGISLHAPIEENLQAVLAARKGQTDISLDEALAVLRAYSLAQTYESFTPLIDPLIAEDDRRRYVIEQIPIPTSNGGTVCATVVRQRATTRQPTLLEFTIYADPSVLLSEARRTASNGYVGVEGLTRGKGCSPDMPVAYEYDGADATALIDWISRQPWSDGRVGMFGASYNGFTTWAAVKHRPPALRAIMDSVTNIPGIDTPMEGSTTNSFSYYWPFYTETNKTLDEAAINDRAHWRHLFRQWYVSGAAYRAMDRIDGKPNPHWDRMLDHPSYDAYWQAMVPFAGEFAKINIPVLTTTGYYDGGQIGALYALTEHEKYNPIAEHYLVIGPYDHHSGNRGTIDVLGNQATELDGYNLDPAALIDIGALRYQWFDYIFKGGAKPERLQDKVNFEIMGADAWGHAPSVAAMADHRLHLNLGSDKIGDMYRLEPHQPGGDRFVSQSMDFKDRSDADRVSPSSGDIVDTAIDTVGSVVFESAPFDRPTDINGLFSGRFDFVTNKKDFDFQVQLYERTPEGKYFELSWYVARASYVPDRTRRKLLTPGVRQHLNFTSGRLTSRRFRPGSRLVIQIILLKGPTAQINYGSGKDVSVETIADAGPPLEIKWFGSSFIDIPIGAPQCGPDSPNTGRGAHTSSHPRRHAAQIPTR
jgi:putative CocE/NonD family hydrolase